MDNNKKNNHNNSSCQFQHQFRPVEKNAAIDRVALHIEDVKNAQQYNQYSFDTNAREQQSLMGYDTSAQYADVSYSVNREYLQIRPGMIYNTVRKNCKREFDLFFKNACSR